MNCVGVFVDDFSLLYRLVALLKEEDLPFVVVERWEELPDDAGVVITTPAMEKNMEASSGGVEREVITVSGEEDLWVAVLKAAHMVEGGRGFVNIFVGVDPGKRPGVAVVGDGDLLRVFQTSHPDDVVGVVRGVAEAFVCRSLVVRVGHGDIPRRNRIINALLGDGFVVELVDETGTSHGTRNTHVEAAEMIARTRGVRVSRPLPINPTEGELREIQRRSRIASGGRFTIGRELARSVAVGDIELEDAVRLHESRSAGNARHPVGGDAVGNEIGGKKRVKKKNIGPGDFS